MAYNHGREDRKWRIWKEAEEKLLRECGVDEATIEQIRMADRADFNSNRRFYRWTNDVAEYLEDMAGRERQERKSLSSISHGGRAYLENRPAENAGVFHKGDCPACAFDDWCHLCEVRPSAEEAAENFIASKTACHPAGYWVRDGNPLTHFLQEDNRMAYRVKAYTLREESTESGTRYFISFKDGQGKSHELEVSEQFFMEFRQMERRNRNLF